MTIELLIEMFGWLGSVMVLLAYGLLTMGKVHSGTLFYQLLNLVGSIGLIIVTGYRGALPSTFVNVVWMMIALPAIVSILKNRNPQPGGSDLLICHPMLTLRNENMAGGSIFLKGN